MRPLTYTGAPVTCDVTTTAQTFAQPTGGGSILVFKNIGTALAYVDLTGGTATASGAGRSLALLPGCAESVTLVNTMAVSMIGAAATTVQMCRAEGGL